MAKQETTAAAPPELREISAAGPSSALAPGYGSRLLQPGDKVLKARGGDYATYEDVLRDDQVFSTFQQRRLAVVSRDWGVEAASDSAQDKAAAEALEENLRRLQWDRITDKMLNGIFYGYAVGECMWELRDGRYQLADVKARKRQRFRFGSDGKLYLLKVGEPDGVLMPDRKFWTYACGADNDDEPYGIGLAHWLYWPVFFKRNDIKFWLIFLEKFGQPTTTGKYPANASEEERDKLLAACQAVATEAAITMPEGFEIELLEAARSGTADYEKLQQAMDAAISKVVLSQTMTTDDGSSKSQSEVHMDVRDEVVDADADLVCGAFNCGPAAWLTEWNFPGAEPPRVWRRVEDEPDLKAIAERDQILHGLGWEPTERYIHETYGEGYQRRAATDGRDAPPEDPANRPAPGTPAFNESCPGCGTAFADPLEDDAIDALVDEMVTADWKEWMGPAGDAIEKVAAESADFEEFSRRLPEALPEMNVEKLGEALARAAFAARIAGSVEAELTDDA